MGAAPATDVGVPLLSVVKLRFRFVGPNDAQTHRLGNPAINNGDCRERTETKVRTGSTFVATRPSKTGKGNAPAFVIGLARAKTWVGHPPKTD
jgi:hypothetical protein